MILLRIRGVVHGVPRSLTHQTVPKTTQKKNHSKKTLLLTDIYIIILYEGKYSNTKKQKKIPERGIEPRSPANRALLSKKHMRGGNASHYTIPDGRFCCLLEESYLF